jgi:hypothetical protein
VVRQPTTRWQPPPGRWRAPRTAGRPSRRRCRGWPPKRAPTPGSAASRRRGGSGVLAVAPLGLCFLPAFVLLGVVPVVAGLAGPLLAGF